MIAYLKQVGTISVKEKLSDIKKAKDAIKNNPIFCPHKKTANLMMELIDSVKEEGDSIGGIVEFIAEGVSAGIGDPVYEKLSANLGRALLSIPACKGFEMGDGFLKHVLLCYR